MNLYISIHSRVECVFWVFYLLCRKIKKKITARFFPRPALGWAGLNFFCSLIFSPHSAIHAISFLLVVIIQLFVFEVS